MKSDRPHNPRENKKPRPVLQHRAGQQEERRVKQRPHACSVYHAASSASSRIEDFIPHGAENAITAREISRLTGLSRRRVTLAIETARKSGILICSDSCNGYFLPVTRAEAQRCIRALRSRWKHQARTLAAMERALAKAENLLP